MTITLNNARLYINVVFFALITTGTSNAGFLGKYAIFERGDEIWLVGEVLENDDSAPRASKSLTTQSLIVVVSCSAEGKCKVQTVKNDLDRKWLPLLTWHENVPVLLSTDYKIGITIESSARKVVSIVGLDDVANDLSNWQMSGGEIPASVLARNRSFGVTRELSGGGMGAAMGRSIDFKSWNVFIGSKESDLTCKSVTFRSLKFDENHSLRIVYGIGF